MRDEDDFRMIFGCVFVLKKKEGATHSLCSSIFVSRH